MPKEVLNTRRKDDAPAEEAVNVSVLLSDYAKLRTIARETRTTTMETLRSTLCSGIRRLAAESAVFTAALCLFLAPSARAGIFGADSGEAEPRMRERQIGFFAGGKKDAYVKSVGERADLEEDCRVLARLVREKEARYDDISRELESRFGMTLTENYDYSDADLTLYHVATNGLFGSSPDNPVRRAHRAFVSQDEADGFVALVNSRTAVVADAAHIKRFLAEKQRALAANAATMLSDFGVSSEKKYRFDDKTGRLFELQPMPTEEELKAQREAEERAIRDAKEHARLAAETKAKAEREARLAREKAEKEAREAKERARREAEAKAKAEKARLEAERKAAEAKARAEREEREKAEKEARLAREKAEKEAKEAKERARREAEAKAKAEKARLEAERKAAEAKARAEREEREKAEKARKAAEKKAREEAEARARAEKKAAEKRAREEARLAEERARRDRKLREDAEKEGNGFW